MVTQENNRRFLLCSTACVIGKWEARVTFYLNKYRTHWGDFLIGSLIKSYKKTYPAAEMTPHCILPLRTCGAFNISYSKIKSETTLGRFGIVGWWGGSLIYFSLYQIIVGLRTVSHGKKIQAKVA